MEISKDIAKKLLNEDSIKALSKSSGASKSQVQKVVSAALPMMMQGMKSNAKSSKKGADSLLSALSSHSGTDLSDIASFLTDTDKDDGDKIVSHVLGGSKQKVTDALSEKSGASKKEVDSILSSIAPALLTLIGDKANDSSTKSDGLAGLLGGLLGGGKDDDDDDGFGLDDIASMLLSGKSDSGSNNGGGKLLGAVLNIFGE